MRDSDLEQFGRLMATVYEFYGKSISADALEIWWVAMKHFDFAAVNDALGRHTMNPDAGRFLPKPADVVAMMGGTTLDSALLALNKVETAVQRVGSYMSVVFDDALIHVVVEEMGGWVPLCAIKTKDWEFRRNEFLNRYRSYRARNELPEYRSVLIGIVDGENASNGFAEDPRVKGTHLRFIGDPEKAATVMRLGGQRPRMMISDGAKLALGVAKSLAAPPSDIGER